MSKVSSDTGPFGIVPEWVIFHPNLSAQAIRVYAVLAIHADRKNDTSWLGRKAIAEEAQCSLSTCDRALGELTNEGALKIESRSRTDGSQTSNLYTIIRRYPATTPVAIGGNPPLVTDEDPMNQNHIEPDTELPRQSEIDSSSPPQAAFRTTVTAFYEAPQKRKVGALIDMAGSLGIKRSGMAAALIRDFGAGKEIVDALKDAASEARGDPWEYMRKVLGNGQESQVRNRRLDTDGRAGDGGQSVAQGGSEILTEEEARRILAARADAEGGGGPGSEAVSKD